jgi:hypothetical protein
MVYIKKDYKYCYVDELPTYKINEISEDLMKMGLDTLDYRRAMCSRVCDLEDTLNIEYIKDWG